MMIINPFMILYGVLSFLAVVVMVHLRLMQGAYQQILSSLENRMKKEEGLEDTDYSRTLTELTRPPPIMRNSRRRMLGKLRDSPTVSILVVTFSMIISGVVAATIIFLIMFSGIDFISFMIFISFFAYLYIHGYLHVILFLRTARMVEIEKMTTKDLRYFETVLSRIKDLQADLIVFVPLFMSLAFVYEMLRDSVLQNFSDATFFLSNSLFLPLFQINIFLGTLVFMFAVVSMLAVTMLFIIKGWNWSRRYRRKLVP